MSALDGFHASPLSWSICNLECWFLRSEETRRTWGKTHRARHWAGIEPRPHWWRATALSPLHHHWSPTPQQNDVLRYYLVNCPSLVSSYMLFFLTGFWWGTIFSWLLWNQNKRYHCAQLKETQKTITVTTRSAAKHVGMTVSESCRCYAVWHLY